MENIKFKLQMMSCYLQSIQSIVIDAVKTECSVLKLHEMDKLKKYIFHFTLICIKYLTLLSIYSSINW